MPLAKTFDPRRVFEALGLSDIEDVQAFEIKADLTSCEVKLTIKRPCRLEPAGILVGGCGGSGGGSSFYSPGSVSGGVGGAGAAPQFK